MNCRRITTAALAAALAFVGTPSITYASTAEPEPAPSTQCTIYISKNPAVDPESSCVQTSDMDLEKAQSAADGTLLVAFHADAGFGGTSALIKGKDGPCDTEGYGLRDMGTLEGWYYTVDPVGMWTLQNASSYRVFNGCNETIMFTAGNYGGVSSGSRFGDQSSVGDPFNDQIRSMLLKAG